MPTGQGRAIRLAGIGATCRGVPYWARLGLQVSESKTLGRVSLDKSHLVAKRLLMVYMLSADEFCLLDALP